MIVSTLFDIFRFKLVVNSINGIFLAVRHVVRLIESIDDPFHMSDAEVGHIIHIFTQSLHFVKSVDLSTLYMNETANSFLYSANEFFGFLSYILSSTHVRLISNQLSMSALDFASFVYPISVGLERSNLSWAMLNLISVRGVSLSYL